MEAGFLPLTTCPVVIGRVQELIALRLLVDRVHGGEGQVALVCGEVGSGKTRLVAEVKAEAFAHGFLLLEGRCFQTDSASPYAPLLDLFRAYVARGTPTSHADPMYSFASTLSPLLPELALLFPALSTLPTPPSVDPEEEKRPRLKSELTVRTVLPPPKKDTY